jgi:hypothetical protein
MNDEKPKPPSDPLAWRKALTFEQAEGAAPLPAQLKPKEISRPLRVKLWQVLYADMRRSVDRNRFFGDWENVLFDMHVDRYSRMPDEFNNNAQFNILELRTIFETGDYVKVFGTLQWILRHPVCPMWLSEQINRELSAAGAAYHVVDRDTIAPIGSDAERETIMRTFVDLAASEFNGARAHLRKAAEELTAGHYADSVRESIHSVEATARVLDSGSTALATALGSLESKIKIHKALRQGFGNIYGYTSDEKGIRHPLLDDQKANVDEGDALFMIGACAAFVSYLINKARTAGLLAQ